MPAPKILSIVFPPPIKTPESGAVEVRLILERGADSTLMAATPDQPEQWLRQSEQGFLFAKPALFVRNLNPVSLRESVAAMARDLGGYWLHYYGSMRKRPQTENPQPADVASVTLASAEPADSPESCSAVAQVTLTDGRIFSILTASGPWFKEAFEKNGLRFYFGPCVLFLSVMDQESAARAVEAMAAQGDRWLCVYDTPRTTISAVLADFKARHP